jgi:translocation protein SEC63
MSSFKDTFSRDEKKDEVEYDNAASYTFGASILLVLIFPIVYKILKRIFFQNELNNDKKFNNCKCQNCSTRLDPYFKEQKKSQYNKSFYFMILSVFLLSFMLYNCYLRIIENNDKIKGFSPWDILEVEQNADEKTIKRAFRRLSLKYHPDKNPNNLQAKAKFIMITKAYEVILPNLRVLQTLFLKKTSLSTEIQMDQDQ